MKLWSTKSGSPDVEEKMVEQFTVGKDTSHDLLLAPYDVIASQAHAKMLGKVGLIPKPEAEQLVLALEEIGKMIRKGTFAIAPGVEDVHSQIEMMLTEKLGEVGKKIHLGRSRNDQVLTAIKLFIREDLKVACSLTSTLRSRLVQAAEANQDIELPGYTHLQVAMPSSAPMWLGAYAESLAEDELMLKTAISVSDKNPLGSAAGYGTDLPLDRDFTTKEIGFAELNENPVYAQMTRGKTEKIAAMALATVAGTLNKLAYDAIFFMTQEINFISFPDHLTTGSSIMPHKKNPDVWEIIRGKTGQLAALPNTITLMTHNLTSGYHRDLQLLKEELFPAFESLKSCLEMSGLMIQNIRFRENILDDEKYKHIRSVEKVNALVKDGMSFRDAYLKVKEELSATAQ
ncbi:MAG: argininosuccinate lyase [Bacteroidia bacterium]|nr:argininosuccinate lyase [Bacteroidia bacterium]